MKSNATTYRIEGELRDWIRDTAHKENISQTTLVRGLLACFRQSVMSGVGRLAYTNTGNGCYLQVSAQEVTNDV